MKRITSLLLAIALIMSLCLPSLALEGEPVFSVSVTGTVDNIRIDERDTLVLDWRLMANKPGMVLTNTQGISLTYDNTVLQLARWDAVAVIPDESLAIEDLGSSVPRTGHASGNYKDINDNSVPMNVYAALSADKNKGYLSLSMDSASGETSWPQGSYISLGQIRFAFREGKTGDDLTPDSIRLMTVAEMSLTNQRYGMLNIATANGGAETFYVYLDQVGGVLRDEGNLKPPKLSYPNSVPTIKSVTITGLAAPVAGGVPVDIDALSTTDEGYEITSILWVPNVSPAFHYETTYNAVILLTSKDGYKFVDGVVPVVNTGTILASGVVGGGDVEGNTLTFTVEFGATGSVPNPLITTDPVSVTKAIGESVTFSVAASSNSAVTGDETLKYQWKKGTVDIPDATGASYTIPSVAFSDAGSYTCAIYDSVWGKQSGTVTSGAAVLTVTKLRQAALTINAVTGKKYGDADFQLTTVGGSTGGPVTYTKISGPATVTPGGMVTITGVGELVVKAVMAGNDTYEDVESLECAITIAKGSQSMLTVNPVTEKAYGDNDFQLSVTGGSGDGEVAYTKVSGPATVSSTGLVTITGAGEVVVMATKAANDYYEAISSAPLTISIAKARQDALIITPVSGKKYSDPPFMLEVTGGTTGGAVSYEKVSGPATISSTGLVTITGVGDIVVKATMAGNANYEDVVSDNRTISIGKTAQSALTVNEVTGKTYGDAPFQLSTTGGSGTGATTYTWISGPATVSSTGLLTITGAGSVVVIATKAADDHYEEMVSAQCTIVIAKAQQSTLTVDAVTGKVYGGGNFQLSASGGSGTGAVTFTYVSGPATITPDGEVTITGAGDIVVTATKAADNNYEITTSIPMTITVDKAQQASLTVNQVADKKYGDAPFQLAASGGSGVGEVTFTRVSGPATVTLSGLVTITGAGDIMVTATKAADDNYKSTTSVPETIIIAKGQQAELTVNPVDGKAFGDAPFQLEHTGGSGSGAVTYAKVSGPATVTPSGLVTITGAGDIIITATKASDTNFEAATSNPLNITVAKALQVKLVIDPVTGKKYGDTDFQLSTTGGSGSGSVTYTRISGPATVTPSGTVAVAGAGDIIVAATKAGDANYEAATSDPLTITIAKGQQDTLTVNAVIGKTYGDMPFQLSTTGGSGDGEVTYTYVSGPATVSASGTVTITGAGDVIVTAIKAGDTNYDAVTSAERTITIAKTQQAALTVNPVTGKKFGDDPFQLSVTGGTTGGTVTYEKVSGTAEVSADGLVTILGADDIVVKATMAGNDNYEPVISSERTIYIGKSSQEALSIHPVTGKKYGDETFLLSTTGGSGIGAVTYEKVSGPAAITPAGMVTITGAGEIVVTATKAGDEDYEPVTSGPLTILVSKAQQAALSVNPVSGKRLGDDPFQLTVTGGSTNGAVTYEVVSGPGTITGDMLTITGNGDILVKATMSGNANYEDVTSDVRLIPVGKSRQATLTVTPIVGKAYGDAPFQLSTSGGSGTGSVTYALISGPATVTSAGLVTITGAGEIVVTATKAGDVNYEETISAELVISIAKAEQSALTIDVVNNKTYGDAPFQLTVSGGSSIGAITYTLVSGPATVTETGLVTIIGAGEIVVTSTKTGDNNYLSITSAQLTISVVKAQQTTLSVTPVTGKKYGDEPFQLATTGGRGVGTVTYTLVSGPAIITTNGIVTITGAGNIVVAASKAGDDNYEAISSDELIINIAKGEQTVLTITQVGDKRIGDDPFRLGVTGGSKNGDVTYELISGTAITISLTGLVTIEETGTAVVKAMMDGDDNYMPVSAEITITIREAAIGTAAAPTASPASGTSFTGSLMVTLFVTTEDADIYYTTDGSVPTAETGLLYVAPITITAATTIKAISWKSDMYDSEVATFIYICEDSVEKSAPPTASPASGTTFTSSLTITLSTSTEGANIYFTTDGSTPSANTATLYTTPVLISSTTTIKAISCKVGMDDSEIATFIYTRRSNDPYYPPNPSGNETIPGNDKPPLTDPWSNPYNDVADTDWFYEAVRFVTETDLMNGTSVDSFSPNVTMSRAMLVTVLYRHEGEPAVSGNIPFSDVKSGEWYSDAILWASRNNIVNGYNSVTFGWNDPVTREQAVVILYRYAKLKGLDVSASADLSKYTDMKEISDWALPAMRWAVAEGIIKGRTATTTVPKGTSTRAEVAMMFKRYIEDFLDEADDSE